MDNARTQQLVEEAWDRSILPVLTEYITIPNKSPQFEPDWQALGHMERALNLLADWCRAQAVPGAQLSIERLPGRTPLICIEVPGDVDDCILMYGHYDKQPEMSGWREGLGPWTPVREGDRLYGRGSADDGYSTFASLTALRVAFVATWVTVMVAPGTIAPEASRTVPEMAPRVICADASGGKARIPAIARSRSLARTRFIIHLQISVGRPSSFSGKPVRREPCKLLFASAVPSIVVLDHV